MGAASNRLACRLPGRAETPYQPRRASQLHDSRGQLRRLQDVCLAAC